VGDKRWVIASFGMRRLPVVAKRTRGWGRITLLLVLVLLVLTGGLAGLAFTVLVLVAMVSARIGHGLGRWKQRPVERYANQVYATNAVSGEYATWAEREIALRDREIERLRRRELGDGGRDG
jgi:hypothetical protein